MGTESKTGARQAWAAATALAVSACAGDPPLPSVAATPQSLPACVLEQRPLTTAGGTEIYVEYEDLVSVGGETLVAGAPSYHWRSFPDRAAEQLSANAFVAAYLGPPARAVPKPITGALASVRVAELDDRRWGAILHEVDPDSLPGIEIFRGLWYGEFDGERWTHLEELEFPGTFLTSRISSGLVRAGERLVWLAWERVPEESRRQVRMYERVGSTWSQFVVSSDGQVEQTALAYLEGAGLWMLLSGYDAGLPGFQKSLRLYRERSPASTGPDRWELVSRVAVAAPDVNLRFARLTLQPGGATVSWSEFGGGGRRIRARVGIGGDTPGTLYTLDEFATFAHPAAMPDGSVVWLVDHMESIGEGAELRLLALEDGRVTTVASFPSPFTAGLAVRAVAAHELLVVGPEMGLDPFDIPVRSLLLRLSTSC